MIVYECLRGMQIALHEHTGDERVHDDLHGQPHNHEGSNIVKKQVPSRSDLRKYFQDFLAKNTLGNSYQRSGQIPTSADGPAVRLVPRDIGCVIT